MLGCKFVPSPWLQMKSWRKKMVLKAQMLEYIEVWLVVYCIRPDRMFAASVVSLFMQEPRQNHFVVGKKSFEIHARNSWLGDFLQNWRRFKSKWLYWHDCTGCLDGMKCTSANFISLGTGIYVHGRWKGKILWHNLLQKQSMWQQLKQLHKECG